MTDYVSDAAGNRPSATVTGFGQLTVNRGTFTVATALANADTVALCKLPAGHIPVDFILDMDDVDDATGIVIDVGVLGTDSDAFIAASTVGQAGGLARMDERAGLRLAPTDADRLVGITVTTGPGTGSTGGVITGTLLSRAAGLDD